MADNCAVAVGGIKLDPSCEALRSPGGIKKEIYIGSISEVQGYTTNATTKDLATLALKAGAKLGKLIGRKFKNSASTGWEPNENVSLFPHSFVFVGYVKTQLEKEAIEQLSRVEDLFAIVHNNDGTFEAYGLVGDNGALGNGLSMTALEHSTGTVQTDGRPWTLTFSGSEAKLPINVSLGADEIATLTELEAMHTTAATA